MWADCEFDDEVVFATDHDTGQLQAFAAFKTDSRRRGRRGRRRVDTAQSATAVFVFDGRRWITEGRAVFNLNPQETVERLQLEVQQVE